LRAAARIDPAHELLPGNIEPEDDRRVAPIVCPEAVALGSERTPRVGQLERPDYAATVVRMNLRGGRRIALLQHRMRPLGAESLVEPLEAGADPGLRRRWQLEICK